MSVEKKNDAVGSKNENVYFIENYFFSVFEINTLLSSISESFISLFIGNLGRTIISIVFIKAIFGILKLQVPIIFSQLTENIA